MLKKIETDIPDLFIIEPQIFNDERGFFFESFSKKKYQELGIDLNFVQDNFSQSSNGTIRGLHYQVGEFAQGKLCQVLQGRVLDVAVDIRFNSPTFGKYYSIELSDINKMQFWIPPGFAHGFSVLSETALFHYKCTNYYSKKDERCIVYDDKELEVNWMVETPIISEKDKLGTPFNNIGRDFHFIENN